MKFLLTLAMWCFLPLLTFSHYLPFYSLLECESCLEYRKEAVYALFHNQTGICLRFPVQTEGPFLAVHLVFHVSDCTKEYIPQYCDADIINDMGILPGFYHF